MKSKNKDKNIHITKKIGITLALWALIVDKKNEIMNESIMKLRSVNKNVYVEERCHYFVAVACDT